jgi:hypothetical protein
MAARRRSRAAAWPWASTPTRESTTSCISHKIALPIAHACLLDEPKALLRRRQRAASLRSAAVDGAPQPGAHESADDGGEGLACMRVAEQSALARRLTSHCRGSVALTDEPTSVLVRSVRALCASHTLGGIG